MNRLLPALVALLLLVPALPGQACTTEDFSGFNFAAAGSSGGTINTYSGSVSTNTVLGVWGQGPGLVQPGCTYVGMGTNVHWNDAGYFGLGSAGLRAAGGGTGLAIVYDTSVTSVSFDLVALAGYPETANVRVYDSSLTLLANQMNVAIPGGTAVPFSFQFADIKRVEIQSLTFPGSPNMDNHVFCSTSSIPTLTLIGQCGQPGSGIQASGMTPNSPIGLAYSQNTNGASVLAGPCGLLSIGLGAPYVIYFRGTADANGEAALLPANGIPAFACGQVYFQGLDIASCTVTNVLAL